MRWEQFFAALESQFDELADHEATAELSDRQRVEQGAVPMSARLAGSMHGAVRFRLGHGVTVAGELLTVGPDWVLVGEGQGRRALIRLAAVTVVEGLTHRTGRPVSGVGLRLDMRRALRGLARDRSPVAVTLAGGAGPDAGATEEVSGTVDRIGVDFLEMALHAPWEPRRALAVRQVVLVPIAAVLVVRPMDLG